MRIGFFPPADWFRAVLLLGLVSAAILSGVVHPSVAQALEGRKPTEMSWRKLGVTARAERGGAVAFDPRGGTLAAGDDRGVWLLAEGGASRQLTKCGVVFDLAFSPEGTLWVVAANGLFRVEVPRWPQVAGAGFANLSLKRVRFGVGQVDLGIRRVAVSPGAVAVGSARGVYLSARGERWIRVPNDLPRGEISGVALRPSADSWELLADIEGQIWETRFRWLPEGGVEIGSVHRQAIPFSGLRFEALNLVYSEGGAEQRFDAIAFGPTHLAMRRGVGGPWRAERLRLPPGVHPLRGAAGEGELWLATDRGLFRRGFDESRWELMLAATDHSLVAGVRAVSGRVVFIGERGLFEGSSALPRVHAEPSAMALPPRFAEEPSIDEVRRAALAYLDLDSKWIRALRRGVRGRGLLPNVALRFEKGSRRIEGDEYDESFSYGELHELRDWDAERMSQTEVSVTLSWNLRDLAYDPESLDVSDEAREVMKIRDDILDELTQLYYDRRRVLLELDGALRNSNDDPGLQMEAIRLRLRADELAAGIDAWTGGWFGERVPRLAAR